MVEENASYNFSFTKHALCSDITAKTRWLRLPCHAMIVGDRDRHGYIAFDALSVHKVVCCFPCDHRRCT